MSGALVATAALVGLLVAPRLHVVEVPLSLWVVISVCEGDRRVFPG